MRSARSSTSTGTVRAGAALRQNMRLACSAADVTLDGNLELAEHRVALASVNEPGWSGGARRDDDLVLAAGVNQDERDARRLVHHLKPAQVDSRLVQPGARELPELVVTDAPDEGHVGAEPRGRHRLVRPLPPGTRSSSASVTVSPGRGSRSQKPTRSRLIDPDRDARRQVSLRGERAEVVERAVHEVLAQVEEAGPERRAMRRRIEPRGRRQALERAHEHRQLEVGGATRAGETTTPARFRTSSQSSSSPAPGSPYQERPSA